MPNPIIAAAAPQPEPRPAPRHGQRAADLIYDEQASPHYASLYGGIWIYPACYDDMTLARRRAQSLSAGFGAPFQVDLFGASGPCGELTTSEAIYEPGYYAFTTHDPRPRLVALPAVKEAQP